MMKSAHYGLRLPERDDQYNINDFDDNFTAIDIAMNGIDNAVANNKAAISDEAESRKKDVSGLTSDLTAHKSDKNNPHTVTKAQVGLGSVENKSSETIRGELTSKNVTDALGYTPTKESDVPSVQNVFNAVRPVGSTYVQYPQQDDPNTLFNKNGVTSTWSVVNYDGAFFRAQGGAAATFIDKSGILTKQAESISHLGEMQGVMFTNLKAVVTGQFSIGDKKGTLHYGSSGTGGHWYELTLGKGSEIRPANYTIRVWKRTA